MAEDLSGILGNGVILSFFSLRNGNKATVHMGMGNEAMWVCRRGDGCGLPGIGWK